MDDIGTVLEGACRRHLHPLATLVSADRLSAGASSSSWSFVVSAPEWVEPRKFVVQLFAGGEQYPGALDKRNQGLVQRAAFAGGVPTPAVRFILEAEDSIGEGFVVDWQQGETLGHRIVNDPRFAAPRERLLTQCAAALAAIHRIAPEGLPSLPIRTARQSVDQLISNYRQFGGGMPIFELALRWLHEHLPEIGPICLVHGDFRVGNFMVDESGLRSILDWEMAHLGEPMEDIGWMMVNAWRFGAIDKPVGGLGNLDQFLEVYQASDGPPVDRAAIRFWQVFGTLQWGVMCMWFARQYIDGSVRRIERLAIGRRVSEVQMDLMDLIRGRE